MSKQSKFLIHCIEIYKNDKSLTGKQVIELFKKNNVLEYIIKYFEALHTTGNKYIINDIDNFINSK